MTPPKPDFRKEVDGFSDILMKDVKLTPNEVPAVWRQNQRCFFICRQNKIQEGPDFPPPTGVPRVN